MASPGRVQGPDLNLRPNLSPAPMVNVTPVAPVNRQGAGSNLMRIADSLAALGNSFSNYARSSAVYDERKKAVDERNKDKAEAKYVPNSLYTAAELRDQAKADPSLMEHEKWKLMYAGKLANEFGTEMGQILSDPEQYDGSIPIDQFMNQKAREKAAEYGFADDPVMMGYFSKAMEPYLGQYYEKYQNNKAVEQATEVQDVYIKNMGNYVAAGRKSKMSNEQIAKEFYGNVSKMPGWNTLTGPQRNQIVWNYISSIAENPTSPDDIALIDSLLNDPRGGVGPISGTADYKEKATILREQAVQKMQSNVTDSQTPIMTEAADAIDKGDIDKLRTLRAGSGNLFPEEYWQRAELQAHEAQKKLALVEKAKSDEQAVKNDVVKMGVGKYASGTAWRDDAFQDVSYPDPKNPGSWKTYSAKDQRKDAKIATLNLLEKEAEANNLPEDVRWGRIAGIFSKSHETIDEWKNAFTSTPDAINIHAAKDQIDEQLVKNAELADYLTKSGNYTYFDSHLDEGSRQFWQLYGALRQGNKMDVKSALFTAKLTLENPGAIAEANTAVNFAEKQSWNDNGKSFADAELFGDPVAAAEVKKTATALSAGMRMSGSEALNMALETYKQTHVRVNNSWLRKDLKGVPDNFEEVTNEFLGSWVNQYGKKQAMPIDSVDDVTLVADPNNRQFYLMDKRTMTPLMGDTVRGGVKRYGPMTVSFDKLNEFSRRKADNEQRQKQADRQAMSEVLGQPAPKKRVVVGRGGSMEVDIPPTEVLQNKKVQNEAAVDQKLNPPSESAYKNFFGAKTSVDIMNLSEAQLQQILSDPNSVKSSGDWSTKSMLVFTRRALEMKRNNK